MNIERRERNSRRVGACALSVVVATVVMGAAPVAHASRLPVLHAVEVSDPVLADIRGKFVSNGRVVYFGVQMITQFTTESGASYQGGLYVGFDRGTMGFRPTMTVMSKAEANDNGSSPGSADSGNIRAGGLNQVSGVSQSVQVTGNGNGAANQVSMNVSDEKTSRRGPSGSGWQPGTVQATSGGGQVQTQVNGGSAGVTVNVPGQGVARQNVVNATGLRQQLQLHGNLNRVMNQMNLDVGVQSATAQMLARQGVDSALASLRNMSVSGRF